MLIGVDVGGTKVLAVAVDDVAPGRSFPSPARATVSTAMPGRDVDGRALDAVVAASVREVAAQAGGGKIVAVGIAAAGLVDRDGELFRFGAHLPWRDAPVRQRLAALLDAPVVLDNDANCAGYAEGRGGAAAGAEFALVVTIGTGIGGALLVDGQLLRGGQRMAGEFGHMRFVPGGLACQCGLQGCWEQYCSGRALEAAFLNINGHRISGPEITRRAQAGDPAALESARLIGDRLGTGLASLTAAFDPERIVIGGGVSELGALLIDPARSALRAHTQAVDHRRLPEIVLARFGAEAGAIGAAMMAAAG